MVCLLFSCKRGIGSWLYFEAVGYMQRLVCSGGAGGAIQHAIIGKPRKN